MSFAGDGGEAGRVVRASVPPGQVGSVIRSRFVERRNEVGPIPFVRRRTFAGGLRSESGARGRSRKSASSPCLRHRSARDRASAHFKSPTTGSSLGLLRPRLSDTVSPRSGVRVSHLPWADSLGRLLGRRIETRGAITSPPAAWSPCAGADGLVERSCGYDARAAGDTFPPKEEGSGCHSGTPPLLCRHLTHRPQLRGRVFLGA